MSKIQTPPAKGESGGRLCPRCGGSLDGSGPEGLCGACMFDSALEAEEGPLSAGPLSLGPQRFGDYELIGEIARGGMGVIYKARQVSLNRTVAVKMILGGGLASVAEVARLRTEAQTAARLRHPHIVAIHEVGEHEGQPFFSMDYVAGQNLAQVVGNTPLPAARAAKYLKAIAEAVHYAHQHGVLHRDLKPSNVLIDSADDQPRVTDFGLAKRLEGDASLTLTGQVLGSPNFMSPEQAAGGHGTVGPASDIYSLGAMLYHLLTGRPPFVAETMTATLRLVAETEPVSPRLLNGSVPRDLETICLKCLQKEPPRRYPTALEVADDLGRFLRDEPIQARPIGPTARVWRWCRRNRALAGAGATVLVLLLTVAIGSPLALLHINRERKRAEENAEKAGRAAALETEQRARAENLAEENRVNLYAARIKVAEQAFQDGNVTHTLQVLESLQPQPGQSDLRSFDWYYLEQLCQSERLTLSHPKRAYGLAFSPDGSLLATVGEDPVVRVWNVTNGLERARLTGHTGTVAAVAFAPDGKTLATAGADATVHVWDVATAKLRQRLQADTNSFTALTFSSDGNLLAGGEGMVASDTGNPHTRYAPLGSPGRILFWDTKTFEPARAVPAHSNGVWTIAFSPDGRTLASGGIDRGAQLREVATGRLLARQTNFPGPVFGVAFSADGRELVAASWFPYHETGEIKILDAATLVEKRRFSGDAGRMVCMALSPDRKKIATAGVDNTARIWDFATGDELMVFHGHKQAIYGVAFGPTGETLATAGWDTAAKVWDLNNSPVRQRIPTAQSYSIAFSPDGCLLACAGRAVELREAGSGKLLAVVSGYESQDIEIVFSPDGQTLVAVGLDGMVNLFDVRTRQLRRSFKGHKTEIRAVAVAPDGKTLATGGSIPDPIIRLWDLNTGAELSKLVGHTNSPWALAFNKDGRVLVSGSWADMRLWDITTGKILNSLTEQAHALQLSPDGKIVACTSFGMSVKLRDAATLRELATLLGHKGSIYELAFSHDDRLLASASWDGTVKVWHLASHQELLTIPSRSGVVWCVAFSPDDRTLAFSSGSNIKGSGEVVLLRAAREPGKK